MGERGSRTCIEFKGTEENPTSGAIDQVFRGMRTSDTFWLDTGLALVSSPETVICQRKELHQRLDHDIFYTNHHVGTMPPEPSVTPLQLFGSEVMPIFS